MEQNLNFQYPVFEGDILNDIVRCLKFTTNAHLHNANLNYGRLFSKKSMNYIPSFYDLSNLKHMKN